MAGMKLMMQWLWWRARLAVAKQLKTLGGNILDVGWSLSDQAAKDYQDGFKRYERLDDARP